MNYTLTFREPCATRIELSGGKGANLALLTQRGFPIPPGFIITAQAYRDFAASGNKLLNTVKALSFDDDMRLADISANIRSTLANMALPAGLVEEVRSRLREFAAGTSFSVRSSSTLEDQAGAAFAGQHETYLNRKGEEQILARIKSCFISLWSERAIAYRHQRRLDHVDTAMAVVVQQMVPCDVAGVAFSINPVTGNLNEMIVDANFGLGESVVSGDGEVDHFVIDKATREIREARIATKTHRIVCVPGGTSVDQPAAPGSNQPCLNLSHLHLLTDLLLRIEQSYAFPQDIEWGFIGSELHLLQSRPITTIPPRWTRDESVERFPNVITPLTWDFVESGFHRSLNHSLGLMGLPQFNGKWFGMHEHYIYGNQNAVELYGRRAALEFRNLDELRTAIPLLREKFRWVQELPVWWQRDLDTYLLKIGEFMTEPLEGRSLPEIWQFVLHVNEQGAQYFLPNIAISITQATLHRLLRGLLDLAVGLDRSTPLFDRLLAWCETRTGTINHELFHLGEMIRAEPELDNALRNCSSRHALESGLLEKFPVVNVRFQKFLRDHGHREVEFDAYAPTWIEVPWVVLDNIRLILQTSMEPTPAQKERELKIHRQQAEYELFQALPADLHFFYGEILRLTRLYTSLDDLEHYETTRLTLPLRCGLRELGSRLAARGCLAEPMDIFFARQKQIDDAIRANTDVAWNKLGESICREKAAYLRDKDREPKWALDGDAEPPPTHELTLTGLAGSPGSAEGPVFLVLGSEDFARFPKNAVLVARTTNPTWTPLFYNAVAVVTESGGPLSHGAVTAREMQLPAVMSVKGSLTRLKNGQRVRVDGTLGRVELLN
jgi:pyruvate,water dikinase